MGFINQFVNTLKFKKNPRVKGSKSKLQPFCNAGTCPLSESCISDGTTSRDWSKCSETTSSCLTSSATKPQAFSGNCKSRKSSKSKGSSGNASRQKMLKKASKSKSKKGQRKGREKSANLKTVKAFIDKFNNFTCEEDLVSLFLSPEEFNFMLEDGFTMTPKMWSHCAKLINASFPDMKFTFDSIQETKPNEVVVEGLRFSGTHTGEPFSFAPEQFPPIPTTGLHVVNDEERFVFEMENGKIRIFRAIALGTNSGPHGMYEQVGGCLVPPLPSPPKKTKKLAFCAA